SLRSPTLRDSLYNPPATAHRGQGHSRIFDPRRPIRYVHRLVSAPKRSPITSQITEMVQSSVADPTEVDFIRGEKRAWFIPGLHFRRGRRGPGADASLG